MGKDATDEDDDDDSDLRYACLDSTSADGGARELGPDAARERTILPRDAMLPATSTSGTPPPPPDAEGSGEDDVDEGDDDNDVSKGKWMGLWALSLRGSKMRRSAGSDSCLVNGTVV